MSDFKAKMHQNRFLLGETPLGELTAYASRFFIDVGAL